MCDLCHVTCAVWPLSCDVCRVTSVVWPASCDLWCVTCVMWPALCDLVAVTVERDWSVHLQWQSRGSEGLSSQRAEHVRRRSLPVWTADHSTQAVHRQVRRQVSQPLAPCAAGPWTVCRRDQSALPTTKCCTSGSCHRRGWVRLWRRVYITAGMNITLLYDAVVDVWWSSGWKIRKAQITSQTPSSGIRQLALSVCCCYFSIVILCSTLPSETVWREQQSFLRIKTGSIKNESRTLVGVCALCFLGWRTAGPYEIHAIYPQMFSFRTNGGRKPRGGQLPANLGWFFKILFLFLGLVVMGRHKCEVIACLSSQTQCELMNCYIVYWIYGK